MKDFKQQWKQLSKEQAISSSSMIQYHIMRAMAAKTPQTVEDRIKLASIFLSKAFTPISNKNKLEHGSKPYQGMWSGMYGARLGDKSPALFQHCLESEGEINLYNQIINEAPKLVDHQLENYYSYFFIRTDLSISQIAIQMGHASSKMRGIIDAKKLIANPDDLNFVLCGVENEDNLIKMKDYLEKQKYELAEFREPDIGNQLTGIAILPVQFHLRGVAKHFPILKFDANNKPEYGYAQAPTPKPKPVIKPE